MFRGPRARECHICGSKCSIGEHYEIHLKDCKLRFVRDQEKLPLYERRRLPNDPTNSGHHPQTVHREKKLKDPNVASQVGYVLIFFS